MSQPPTPPDGEASSEIPAHLAGIFAKLSRAYSLIAELDSAALGWMRWNRPSFDVVSDFATTSYTVTGHIESPPLSMAIVFGEVLHDLRSALDHIARLMVLAEGRVPVDSPPRATAFPIHLRAPAKGLRVSPGLAAAALSAVENLQPYRSGDPQHHPLWRLSELNNIDKHRLLNVTSLSGSGGVAFLPAPLDPTISTPQEQRRHVVRLLPGVPQHFVVTPEEMHDPAAIVGLWSYAVVLGEPGTGFQDNLSGVGRGIADYIVNEALPTLAPFAEPAAG